MLQLALSTIAFSGPSPLTARSTVRMSDAAPVAPVAPSGPPKMSQAVPFLTKSMAIDGMAGDSGFDPLFLSSGAIPVSWMAEAEIKHGRVCMLAVVGMLVPQVFTLPGREMSVVAAHDAGVASGSMTQMFLWIGLFEAVALVGTLQMLQGSGRKPGYFGFDPLGFSKKEKDAARLATAEIKNGRLAMLAFSGMITQAALTGNGFPFIYS